MEEDKCWLIFVIGALDSTWEFGWLLKAVGSLEAFKQARPELNFGTVTLGSRKERSDV